MMLIASRGTPSDALTYSSKAFRCVKARYGETLRRWRANLARVAPELRALGLDRRFARLWNFYFAYCEAGFDERYISATQLLYATPTWRPRPTSAGAHTRETAAV